MFADLVEQMTSGCFFSPYHFKQLSLSPIFRVCFFFPDSFDFAYQKDQGINVIQVWLQQVTENWYSNTPLPLLFNGIVLACVLYPSSSSQWEELQLPTVVID